jgi:FixJ family two-component response regulator
VLTDGLDVKAFDSGLQFLSHTRAPVPSCLVLDVNLPDLNGLELQKRICGHGEMPIIFLTGCGDVRTTVAAMKAGAFEFLTKPFGDEVLLGAIRGALERSRATLQVDAEMGEIRARYSALSQRERQVMSLVVSGLLNKQVGGELGISEITVKAHRGRVMRKMCARTFVELVTLAARFRAYSAIQ